MIPFDVTMTATLRPELIKKTLDSHIKYLFATAAAARLIVNVDLAGAENRYMNQRLRDTLDVIYSYPWRDVVLRIGVEPFFPAAFFWCFDQVLHKYVFHLEEDWEMLQDIDFDKMFELMEEEDDLVHLRLSEFVSTEKTLKCWNKYTYWNGDYFEVAQDDKGVIGWCGHPSLNRSSFMRPVLAMADRKRNPEKQIKGRRYNHPINDFIGESKFGVFSPQNSGKTVLDIGRAWMVEHGWVKAGNKSYFTNWTRAKKE